MLLLASQAKRTEPVYAQETKQDVHKKQDVHEKQDAHEKAVSFTPPRWAKDAKWYYILVPRFHNGSQENDPPNVQPWSIDWLVTSEAPTSPEKPETVGPKSPNEGTEASHQEKPSPSESESTNPLEGTDALDSFSFGGDLQGVEQRLTYLKELGVNTLLLSPVFRSSDELGFETTDYRHVRKGLAVAIGSSTEIKTIESHEPQTWSFAPSDKQFLASIKKAHTKDFRVVLEVALTPAFDEQSYDATDDYDAKQYLFHIARRWMDPDGNGDASDGVDGWWIIDAEQLQPWFLEQFQAHVRRLNAQCVVVTGASLGGGGTSLRTHSQKQRWFSSWEYQNHSERSRGLKPAARYPLPNGRGSVKPNPKVAELVRKFFGVDNADNENYAPEKFLNDLGSLFDSSDWETRLAAPMPLHLPGQARSLTVLSHRSDHSSAEGASAPLSATASDLIRWRLATVCQHCLPGAPLTYYGDESGMESSGGALSRAPMRWEAESSESPPEQGVQRGISQGVQEDFASLIQWLHVRRELHPALKHGRFRPVMHDEKHKLFAFARTLPEEKEEVIVVFNYGNDKQQVTLSTGKPNKLIGILIPHLRTSPKLQQLQRRMPIAAPNTPLSIKPLWLNGARQFADDQGQIKFWIGPQAVRLVVIMDQPPE